MSVLILLKNYVLIIYKIHTKSFNFESDIDIGTYSTLAMHRGPFGKNVISEFKVSLAGPNTTIHLKELPSNHDTTLVNCSELHICLPLKELAFDSIHLSKLDVSSNELDRLATLEI